MDKEFNDIDYPGHTVTLKLARIQQRCTQLLEEPDELELCLEEPVATPDSNNPYDRGSC